MRGRKPLPNDVKKLKGVRASRINDHEPEFEQAGPMDPPKSLRGAARKFWKEVYPELAQKQVLRRTDIPMFEELCRLYAEVQTSPSAVKRRMLQSLAVEFGLTPSSRTRLSTEDSGKPKSRVRDFWLRGLNGGPKRS